MHIPHFQQKFKKTKCYYIIRNHYIYLSTNKILFVIMKVKSLVVLATIVVIAMITCSFTMKSDVKWITVSGYVDNTNGDVISQVDVTCTLNSNNALLSRTKTDPEGYYSIQVKQSESCTLSFSHANYVPQDKIVSSSTNIDDMNVTLHSQEE